VICPNGRPLADRSGRFLAGSFDCETQRNSSFVSRAFGSGEVTHGNHQSFRSARFLTVTACGIAFAVSGCGGDQGGTYAPSGGYKSGPDYSNGGSYTDPAAALEEQRRNAEAISESSQMLHEARMDVIDSMTP
jgi:hypothetical protein